MENTSDELMGVSEDMSQEELENSSQKRKLEEWKKEQDERKRAKSALDHQQHPNSFASLAAVMSSLNNDEVIKDDPIRNVPLAQRPVARKHVDAFVEYRDRTHRIMPESMEETEDIQFESQIVGLGESETQAETQTMIYKRIRLHPHVVGNFSAKFRERLKKYKIDEFEISAMTPSFKLGRQVFMQALQGTKEESDNVFEAMKLSKEHVAFKLVQEPGGRFQVYAVDLNSTNGTKVDGLTIEKGKSVILRHDQTISLLSTVNGTVMFGYIVEDPHVLGAHRITPSYQALASAAPPVQLQENVLGVLFAEPLVGKDCRGQCHPLEELDLAKEYANLKDALIEASKRARIKPTDSSITEVPREVTLSVQFATTDSLRSLMTLGCRAFHFSGHGNSQTLYFEDGQGTVHPVPIKDLKNLCVSGNKNTPLRLVVVQACYSHNVATAFLECGIPHVIAVKFDQKIEDLAAAVFTKAFYMALATGKSVEESFCIGRDAVQVTPHLAHAAQAARKFELLPEGADHSEIIFPTVEYKNELVPSFKPNSKRFPVLWAHTKLPAVCSHFCNRIVDQYIVIHDMVKEQPSHNRFAWITGPPGIGKTQLAQACCRYMNPRGYFGGGILFINIEHHVPKGSTLQLDSNGLQKAMAAIRSEIDEFVRSSETSASQATAGTLKRMLVVLDDCDALLSSDSAESSFANMVHTLFTNHYALKMIFTARKQIVSDRLQTHGGGTHVLQPFAPEQAAALLRRHVTRKLSIGEMQLSTKATTMERNPHDNLTIVLSEHPLIKQTQGIPHAIVSLASLINSTTASLDQLALKNTTQL